MFIYDTNLSGGGRFFIILGDAMAHTTELFNIMYMGVRISQLIKQYFFCI